MAACRRGHGGRSSHQFLSFRFSEHDSLAEQELNRWLKNPIQTMWTFDRYASRVLHERMYYVESWDRFGLTKRENLLLFTQDGHQGVSILGSPQTLCVVNSNEEAG